MDVEFPDRDSREWMLGPRGASLEPWAEAAANLPAAEHGLAALVCVPQTAPTLWMRDDVLDDLTIWDELKRLVQLYDAGERDPEIWTEVLGGQGHLVVLGDRTA